MRTPKSVKRRAAWPGWATIGRHSLPDPSPATTASPLPSPAQPRHGRHESVRRDHRGDGRAGGDGNVRSAEAVGGDAEGVSHVVPVELQRGDGSGSIFDHQGVVGAQARRSGRRGEQIDDVGGAEAEKSGRELGRLGEREGGGLAIEADPQGRRRRQARPAGVAPLSISRVPPPVKLARRDRGVPWPPRSPRCRSHWARPG